MKFVSWNVRGINSPIKRTKILNHLKKLNADICLLQETHLLDSEHKKLQTSQFSHIFFSSYSSKKRGVAILIRKNLTFTINKIITDTEGRYIIINFIINNNNITIANIYGPNTDDENFFHTFFSTLSGFSQSAVIIGGDFNTVINPILDKSNASNHMKTWHSTEIIKQYMTDFGLGDNWRQKNPTIREYTYFSPVHKSYSRIDFFLTSNSIMSDISNTTIEPIIISDHAPITFTLYNNRNVKASHRWRMNISLLQDQKIF